MTRKAIKDGAYFETDAMGRKLLFTKSEAEAFLNAKYGTRSNSNPRVATVYSTGSVWRFDVTRLCNA